MFTTIQPTIQPKSDVLCVLNEMALLNTQNKCSNMTNKKIFTSLRFFDIWTCAHDAFSRAQTQLYINHLYSYLYFFPIFFCLWFNMSESFY